MKLSTIRELFTLFLYLPNLTNIYIHRLYVDREFSNSLPRKTRTTHLKIKLATLWSSDTFEKLKLLLLGMPELKVLSIEASGKDFPDGHQWKHLTEENIPFLTKFRFEFRMESTAITDELLSTFRTNFWLNSERWSAVCERKNDPKGHLFSCQTI